jgi:hypothetical protein
MGSRKKIAKCFMRTFTRRSTFLYDHNLSSLPPPSPNVRFAAPLGKLIVLLLSIKTVHHNRRTQTRNFLPHPVSLKDGIFSPFMQISLA